MKVCNTRNLSDVVFTVNRNTKDGFQSNCRECNKKKVVSWRNQNPFCHRISKLWLRSKARITSKQIEDILVSQLRKCKLCEVDLEPNWHLDHIVPVKLGGSGKLSNLQALCRKCNMWKSGFLQSDLINHAVRLVNVAERTALKIPREVKENHGPGS